MAFYNNRSFALERGFGRRPRPPLGTAGRLAGRPPARREDPDRQLARTIQAEPDTEVHRPARRFEVVRRGYDPRAVDECVSGLEGELAALDLELATLRSGEVTAQAVASELQRIGEQTSAVLIAAHEQREQILREAQAEAERRVAEATKTADVLTARCEQHLRELGAQTEVAESERDRLVAEIRRISTALTAVADSSGPPGEARPGAVRPGEAPPGGAPPGGAPS